MWTLKVIGGTTNVFRVHMSKNRSDGIRELLFLLFKVILGHVSSYFVGKWRFQWGLCGPIVPCNVICSRTQKKRQSKLNTRPYSVYVWRVIINSLDFVMNRFLWSYLKPATFVSSNYAKNCSILTCPSFSLLVVRKYF